MDHVICSAITSTKITAMLCHPEEKKNNNNKKEKYG